MPLPVMLGLWQSFRRWLRLTFHDIYTRLMLVFHCRLKMGYNYWVEDSELNKHVEAECFQRTANDSTSQPQQSMDHIQYGLVVTEPPVTYGDATTNNYPQTPQTPHYDLSESGLSQPNIGSDAAGQSPHDVSSNYLDYVSSHYQSQRGPEPEHPVNNYPQT
ncbi:hypothetical protein K503DRAFT_101933, partial [Rhizopogon vinicolor AM-OR11-026]